MIQIKNDSAKTRIEVMLVVDLQFEGFVLDTYWTVKYMQGYPPLCPRFDLRWDIIIFRFTSSCPDQFHTIKYYKNKKCF